MSVIDVFERLVISRLPQHALCIDGGAGHGAWTEAVLEARPFAHVVCYEPHPEHVAILHKKFDDDHRVQIVEAALSDEYQEGVTLYVDDTPEHLDFGSSLYPRDEVHQGTRNIKVVRLDGGSATGRVHMLKLDLEGGELNAMRGMGLVRPELIQFEYSADTWGTRHSIGEAEALLIEMGYEIENLPHASCRYINVIAHRRPEALFDVKNALGQETTIRAFNAVEACGIARVLYGGEWQVNERKAE